MKPGTFLHFATHVIKGNPKPTRAQAVYISVIFDRVDPVDLASDEDRAIARELFGDVERFPDIARDVVCSLKGARVGGTLWHSLFLLFAGLTLPLRGLSVGEVAFGVIVAPDMRLAGQAFRYVTGAIDATGSLDRLVTTRTATSVTLKRPHDGQSIVVECLPATRGGSALRGRTFYAVLMDESSFFRAGEDNAVVNDGEIFGAVDNRVMPGGLLSVISTPHAEIGLLWSMVTAEWGKPETCLAVRARTLTMRPDMLSYVERQRRRDPARAAREFDLVPWGNATGLLLDLDSIKDAINPRLQTPLSPRPGVRASAGVDTALISDSSAGVVLYQYRGGSPASYAVAETLEMRPRKGAPLRLSSVCGAYVSLLKRHGLRRAMADGHELQPSLEWLTPEGVTLIAAPAGNAGKMESFLALKTMLSQGQLSLPSNEPRLVEQLREITCRPLSGGGLQIRSPRKAGHGDLVSALVLAAWQFTGGRKSSMALYLEMTTDDHADQDKKPFRPDWAALVEGSRSTTQENQ